GCFLCGTRALRRRPACRGPTAARSADPAATFRGDIGIGNAAPRTALVAAAGFLVHRRPSAPLGFLFPDAPLLVTLLDMFGLAFLLVGIAGFVAARHDRLPGSMGASSSEADAGSQTKTRSRPIWSFDSDPIRSQASASQ